jgi:hypothetical protein
VKRVQLLPILVLVMVLAMALVMVACSPIEQQARNTAAALHGAISAAQAQYQSQCSTNPGSGACITITRAIDGQNALITAVEAYCGWSPSAPPPTGSQTCVPVKSAAGGLQTAVNNANLFIAEIKGVLKP